jgi:hypothetical protein
MYDARGIRRVSQKHKLLYVFANPGSGGEMAPVSTSTRAISEEEESLPAAGRPLAAQCGTLRPNLGDLFFIYCVFKGSNRHKFFFYHFSANLGYFFNLSLCNSLW